MSRFASIVVLLLIGCQSPPDNVSRLPLKGPVLGRLVATGYAYHRPDGNRLTGRLDLSRAGVLDIAVSGTPMHVVGLSYGGWNHWLVVFADGRLQAWRQQGAKLEPVPVLPAAVAANPRHLAPVAALDESGRLYLANVIEADNFAANTLVWDPVSGSRLFVSSRGHLGWTGAQGEVSYLDIRAHANSRLLLSDSGMVAVLSENGHVRYGHDVLGGGISNSLRVNLVTVKGKPAVESVPTVEWVIEAPTPRVFEGNHLFWADLDRDGTQELVTTESDSDQGARVHVYDRRGGVFAAGSPIGLGSRWRHVIAAADFESGGNWELVSTLTPHIGGHTEFFKLSGKSLLQQQSRLGYTSHSYLSAQIDMAVAGNFDEDDALEVLIPDETYQSLGVIQLENGACCAKPVSIALDGRLRTNIASATGTGGGTALAAGMETHIRIWY